MKSVKILLAAMFALSTVSTEAADEYHVDKEGENQVVFLSKAPLEEIEGTTDQIDGYIQLQGTTPDTSSTFHLQVELNSLDTGIGLRNQHMRDNYLETEKYPRATFTGKVTRIERNQEGVFNVETRGEFNLHGQAVTRDIKVRVERAQERVLVTSEFDLALPDHNIKVPKLMVMKISEIVRIKINLTLKKIEPQK